MEFVLTQIVRILFSIQIHWFISVSTMHRMVSQIGTPQDSPDHKQQL